jgi:hypothetical protein
VQNFLRCPMSYFNHLRSPMLTTDSTMPAFPRLYRTPSTRPSVHC